MRSLLREPLVHFVVVAALLFGAHALWSRHQAREAATIYISASDMERMAALYAAEAGGLPGPEDMQGMVADHVRNEALAREARRLGLDAGDTIIERRLAQKMTFMVEDLADAETPDESTLRDWYGANPDAFRRPPRVTFQHVYFSTPDAARITAALTSLNGETPADWKAAGDPFMLQRQYADLPARETVRLFGPAFTTGLLALEPGEEWTGPLPSALGTHLVRLEAKQPDTLPPFEDISSEVETHWRDAARREQNADAIAEIVSRYRVEIEGIDP